MTPSRRCALPPAGLRYQAEFISPAEEEALCAHLCELPLREFEFHGYVGKRRTISYGWRYDFADGTLQRAGDMPDFLLALRERAAAFAGLAADELAHALVTEYRPGAAIGWHRDKAAFADVIGISLLSPCMFRLRRKAGGAWERFSLLAEARSAYLLRGIARTQWEHSIPAVAALRYSVTFRSLRRSG